MVFFLGFGVVRKVPVYEVMVEGGKEGFQVALRIIPYMVVILVAVGMLRASGALDLLVGLLGQVTGKVGLPAEALAHGADAPAFRLRRLRHYGVDHQRSGHRP